VSYPVRALLVALLGGALALPPAARAAGGFAASTLDPAPAGDCFLAVPDSAVEGHLVAAAALDLGWAHRPLVLRVDGEIVPGGELLQRQLELRLGLSLALWDRVRLDLSAPVVVAQAGQTPLPSTPAVSGAAAEDLRVGARASLWRGERLAVAAALALWLPTGDAARFASDGVLRAEPSLLAGGRLGRLAYAGEVGALLRRTRTVLFTEVGPALDVRAAAGWLLLDGRIQVGPELYGRYQRRGTGASSLEALASVRWEVSPRWSVSAALGTRLGADAPGAAPLRALARVTWSGDVAAHPQGRPSAAPEPPAPAPLRGGTSVVAVPAPGYEATAPSPEPARAVVPGPWTAGEEPAPVAQPSPVAPPQPVPARVEVSSTRLRIRETIAFDLGTAVLQGSAEAILDMVAGALLDAPHISLVTVEGHTDAMGRRTANLALSLRRAEAVRTQLLLRGVAPSRLRAVGLGPDRPVGDDETAAGREANRRVDFLITAVDGP
jgi:outer membrane protein OmpA-like peptidoglycan-associated protein